MKRLFNKRSKPSSTPESLPPLSSSPSLTPPPNSSSTSTTPPANNARPPPTHQHSGQIQYGPDGLPYMLMPVTNGAGAPGWNGQGGNGGIPRPPRVQDVGNAIGWSCAMPTFEWSYLLALSDYLTQGRPGKGNGDKGPAEEAAKALRKEFKHATPTAQERAVRLTFLLARNSDEKFRREIASKKFLSELSDLVTSKTVDPKVKDMVFRILSPLAFDNQSDPTLSALTQTYNRLLPSLSTYPTSLSPSSPSFQPNGSPLSSDDPLLTPEGLLSSSSRPSRPRNERILTGLEELKRLERKAKEGRAYAGMLGEAVQGRVSEGGEAREVEGDEMVQEFYAQALAAQDLLSSNLDWASVQAEQSRICALEAAGIPVSEGAGEGPEQTEEERVLEVLLGASSEVSEALALYSRLITPFSHPSNTTTSPHGLTLAEQEEADILAATERSKADVHYDRFAPHAHERQRTHDYGEGVSGEAGGWESVEQRELAMAEEDAAREREEAERRTKEKGKGKARSSLNPYADYLEAASTAPASPSPVVAAPASAAVDSAARDENDPYGGLDSFAEGLSFSSPSSRATNNFPPAVPAPIPTAPVALASLTRTAPQFSSSNPYAALSLSPSALSKSQALSESPSSAGDSPFSSSAAADPFADAGGLRGEGGPGREGGGVNDQTETRFLGSFVPEEPSRKALGKLRRVSEREDTSQAEQQARLEAALREKYKREYEEEAARRGRED